MFGKNVTNPLSEIGSCPIYIYDETNKIYYYPEPQCGGATDDRIKSYKSKFTTLGDEAYVYISFAFVRSSSVTPENIQYTIYKDFSYIEDQYYGTAQYKDIYKENIPSYQVNDFIVNSENYKNFSEYKFTFKKDKNNNYYFTKVEQTK